MVNSVTKNIRVLHVDDDSSFLEISKLMLTEMNSNFSVAFACSVDEALQKLTSDKSYDVVVSDYEMPLKNGLEFLTELKEKKINVPFILFTGKGREEIAIQALNLGADGYYNKQGHPETVYGELTYGIRHVFNAHNSRKSLREHQNRFDKLAMQTPGMLYQFKRRPDGTYCLPFTSDLVSDFFGCTPEEVKEDFSPIAKAIHPEDFEKVVQSIEKSAKEMKNWQMEYRVLLPGKKVRWMFGKSKPEKQSDGSILWSGFLTDITERRKTENKLQRNSRINQIFHGLYSRAMDLPKQEFYRYFLKEALFLSNSRIGFFNFVSEDQKTITPAAYNDETLKDCKASYTTQYSIESAGNWADCLRLKRPVIYNAYASSPNQKGLPQGHIQIKRFMTVPVIEEGKVRIILGAGNKVEPYDENDSTELQLLASELLKILKRHVLEERLNSVNERLRVVGGLTRHDVANKLMAAKANMYLLRKRLKDEPELLKFLDKADNAFNQANEIFEFSRLYEQIGAGKLSFVNVADKFDAAAKMLTHSNVTVVNKVQGLKVLADDMLQQLFYSLIDNSLKHGKNVTKIQLSFKNDAKEVKLVYLDDGVGVTQENKLKIFEEGFTTGGSGLGLKLAKRLVEVYGWNMVEKGKPGKGAKFVITIPKTTSIDISL